MDYALHVQEREYANVFTRFGAIIIDGLLFIPFYFPILLIGFMSEPGAPMDGFEITVTLFTFLGAFVFGIWNSIIRMGQTGQSLGKRFLNIAVLTKDDRPIGVGSAALREIIGKWISGMVCYIGYLNALWDKDNQMWHDKISSCYVYNVEDNFS